MRKKKCLMPYTIHKRELWLYDLINEKLVKEIKRSLHDENRIDLGSFLQYLDEE